MIEQYLNQTISLERASGVNGNGEATFAAAATVAARVERKRRMVRDSAGREVMSDTTVFLAPGTTITAGDMLDSEEVIAVEPLQGLDVELGVRAYTGRGGRL